jgi:DNA-binding transcriptional MocR family regulator
MPETFSTLTRSGGKTLVQQLAARTAERIAQRLLAPGARLPSVRECARRHRVSPATVVAAYDRLQAQGLVEARPQRGFFVREAAPIAPRREGHRPPAARPAPVDATALIRSMFEAQGGAPMPGLGMLPADWLDGGLLQRALRRVAAADPQDWLRYGTAAGDAGLRDALARRMADVGIMAAPAQIVTTVGATHALDVVSRALLQPGDAVLVDEPGWAIEYARLSRLGMKLLPVPRRADGPDLAVMETLAKAHRPRLYSTVSVLHNPTGATLNPAAAHQVLRLADAHDFVIVEDDTYAYFAPPHATRLAQLDRLERTVYVSGFSKILAPQWRIGWLAAGKALVDRLIDTKLLSTLTTAAPLERALALCLDQGSLRRHAERVAAKLDAARSRVVRLAQDAGFGFAAAPQGLFGWLDMGVDTEALAQALLDDGWLTAPGSLFHVSPRPTMLMRVNFASSLDLRFWRAARSYARGRARN